MSSYTVNKNSQIMNSGVNIILLKVIQKTILMQSKVNSKDAHLPAKNITLVMRIKICKRLFTPKIFI